MLVVTDRGRWLFLILIISILVMLQSRVLNANTLDEFFERHGVPMLWIEPNSGRIVGANPAAQAFYGF
ncbi:MAG: hypothetical protein LRY63_09435 [Nitrincola sp.]|nr:hypothetical protein [Nitrincola sp.]